MSAQEIERITARRALALVVAAAMLLMGVQLLTGGMRGGAFAQTAPSPTSTGPSIEFLNPEDGTSREISNKEDVDTAYHLNTFVGQVPASPFVEFEIQSSSSTNTVITHICDGTRRGHDTFDCFWGGDFNGLADGTYTLRAILYSGQTEVDRDEETVRINRRNPSTPLEESEAAAETVEITWPANAGQLGYFTDRTGTSRIIIQGIASAEPQNNTNTAPQTTYVKGYYSLTPPGDEPTWTDCGYQRATDDDDDSAGKQVRVRCTIAEAHDPRFITAVALVANDTTPNNAAGASAEFDDSGDAHRVFTELQNPTTVVVDPPVQQQTTETDCAHATVTVLDQFNQLIAGANVDVHAQGPSDQLRFDTSTSSSSEADANQPPDQGGHTNEIAYHCNNDQTSGMQGERNIQGGDDVKHIESTTGTNRNGEWAFGLRSDVAGLTAISVWADENGDDLHCTQEAGAAASIRWGPGDPPAAPVGVPADQSSCDTTPPSPTPTGAQTTATSTPTQTAGTTPTPTDTGTATPTNTATTTSAGPAQRSVALTTDKERMPAGRKVTFSGQISSTDPSCIDQEVVQIRRRILGTDRYEDLFALLTDDQGSFSAARRARKSAEYLAVVSADANCSAATSSTVRVLVKVLISILPSDKNPQRGSIIRIKSAVKPQHDRTRLVLQRKKGRRWIREQEVRMNNRSRGNFFVEINFNRRTFRTMWPSQHQDHESNRSRAVTIRSR